MKSIIRLLVAAAAGLEAASDTYRAVTQQQQAVEQLLHDEQQAITDAQTRRHPIGFASTIQKKDQVED